MAAPLPRTASGLANSVQAVLRPRCLLSSTQSAAVVSRRCLHQTAPVADEAATPGASETTTSPPAPNVLTYEQKPMRLEYQPVKRYQNVRPQPLAPFAVRVRQPYIVNDSPKKLDAMYRELFGGDKFKLPNELKWQAVTHKSFDHGRQPYNEKLMFMGTSLLKMHAAMHIMERPPSAKANGTPSEYKSLEGHVYQQPTPFQSPDYRGLSNVNPHSISSMITDGTLDPIIARTGLAKVMRWKPMSVKDLNMSGRSSVAADCLKAIVGAVALHHGGDAAEQFIKTRIFNQDWSS